MLTMKSLLGGKDRFLHFTYFVQSIVYRKTNILEEKYRRELCYNYYFILIKCVVDTWIEWQTCQFVSKRHLSNFWNVRSKCDKSFTCVYSRHVLLPLDARSNTSSTDNTNDRMYFSEKNDLKVYSTRTKNMQFKAYGGQRYGYTPVFDILLCRSISLK